MSAVCGNISVCHTTPDGPTHWAQKLPAWMPVCITALRACGGMRGHREGWGGILSVALQEGPSDPQVGSGWDISDCNAAEKSIWEGMGTADKNLPPDGKYRRHILGLRRLFVLRWWGKLRLILTSFPCDPTGTSPQQLGFGGAG